MSDEPMDPPPATPAAPAGPAAQESTPLGAVTALMDERRRFEGWIAALDQRRATTPPHVFTRVQADYSARLAGVVQRLAAHADALRSELGTLTERLAGIDAEQQLARDERAEGELRAHVGELTPEAWEEAEMASDIKLEELATRRAAVQEQLDRTRELLGEAERPASGDPAAPAGSEAGAPAGPSDEGEGALHVPAASAAETAGPVTEPMEVSASVIAAEQQLIDADASGADSLGLQGPAVDTPIGAMDAAPADRPDEASRRDSFSMRAQKDDIVNLSDDGTTGLDGSAPALGRAAEPPMAANVSGNTPIVLRDKPAEAAKTLKCSECGSMNYATEWYCERCGAELASL